MEEKQEKKEKQSKREKLLDDFYALAKERDVLKIAFDRNVARTQQISKELEKE